MAQTLMLVEATGIQPYIFGSNKLAQQVGASELVRQVTVDLVLAHLREWRHNFQKVNAQGVAILSKQTLEDDALDVEVVYAGGGNVMAVFADDQAAGKFVRQYTRDVLEKAPGLNLVVMRRRIEFGQGRLHQSHQELRGELAKRKLDRQLSVPLQNVSVTASGAYTGAPAVGTGKAGELISAEVAAKLDLRVAERLDRRLTKTVPRVEEEGYAFPPTFDDFGTHGKSRYLAVIHTDGNGMGERIKQLGKDHAESDRAYIAALRAFSDSIEAAARDALQSTADLLLDAIEGEKIAGEIKLHKHKIPFRPIVYGGDDVTFVADGRLGLALAAHYVQVYSGHKLSDKQAAHARAGIAIIKSHFPFALGYHLAEQLAHQAKMRIKRDGGPDGMTALDWHIAKSGLIRSLDDIRAVDYSVQGEGSLLMRPLSMGGRDDWRSWRVFRGLVDEFGREKWPRTKRKALQEQLRRGRVATAEWLSLQGNTDHRSLPAIRDQRSMPAQGWQGERCGYYDALEAMDGFFIALEDVSA